jgi:hypothetical protein
LRQQGKKPIAVVTAAPTVPNRVTKGTMIQRTVTVPTTVEINMGMLFIELPKTPSKIVLKQSNRKATVQTVINGMIPE